MRAVFALLIILMAASVFAQGPPPGAPEAPAGGSPSGTHPGVRPSSPQIPARPGSMAAPCVLPSLGVLQPRMTDMLAMRLTLTDDQKTKLQDLLTKSEEQSMPLVQEQQKAAKAFAEMLTDPAATQAQLAAAGESVMKAEAGVLTTRVKLLFDTRALLNDDQKAGLNSMLERYTNVWKSGPIARETAP